MELSKDDWCTDKGGLWRTIQGNRICIFPGESVEDSFKYRMFQIDNPKDKLVETAKSKYETQDPSRAHFILQDGSLIAMGMVGSSHDDIKEVFTGNQKLVYGDGTKFFMRSTDAMRVKTSTIGGVSNIMVEVWTSQDITSTQWGVLEGYVEHNKSSIIYYDVMGSNGLSLWSNVIEDAKGKDIYQVKDKYDMGKERLGKGDKGKDEVDYKVSLIDRWERRGYKVRERQEDSKIKSLNRKPYDYICFELLRLRTRYDNEKDNAVKVRITKRYREVRKEFDNRGSQWIPSEHELDRIIKAVENVEKGIVLEYETEEDLKEGLEEIREEIVESEKKQDDAGRWVTLENGQKVFIREGESFNEAVGRLNPSKEPKAWKVNIQNNGLKDDSKYDADRIIHYLPDEDIVGIEKVRIDNAVAYGRGPKMILAMYEAGGETPTEDAPKRGSIFIAESVLSNEDKARNVIFHEVGHHVERRLIEREQFSDWFNFFTENKNDMPSDYSKTDVSEGFAECYSNFHDNKASPKIEKWFKDHGYKRKE